MDTHIRNKEEEEEEDCTDCLTVDGT